MQSNQEPQLIQKCFHITIAMSPEGHTVGIITHRMPLISVSIFAKGNETLYGPSHLVLCHASPLFCPCQNHCPQRWTALQAHKNKKAHCHRNDMQDRAEGSGKWVNTKAQWDWGRNKLVSLQCAS